ncbi:MAG TPA: nucleotidyltransferase family protein [Pyrinomonadaceae bacterium]|nr:nucleotidyltransferase family protein [Pyrinomonadaceae bacterium]
MKRKDNTRTGRLMSKALAGSWRQSAFPAFDLTLAELDELTPLLCSSGAAALAWNRISQTDLRDSASGEVLHHAARLQSLQTQMHEEKVEKVFRLLQAANIDVLLAKGWAASGLYSNRDLRPSGDIDLCVRPEDFKLTEEVLSRPEASDCWVDLHKGFYEFPERTPDELFARTDVVHLGKAEIRILGREDHLALLCIHFLKHGGWRPLWLCDISAAIESLPSNFDWNTCLGRNKTRARWIECAISLAQRLLEADSENLPVGVNPMNVPAWLVDNVLQQWATPFAMDQPPMSHPLPMAELLRRPSGLLEGLGKRWPNPILATVSVEGSFNEFPRFPYQLANCVSRAGRFLVHGLKGSRQS